MDGMEERTDLFIVFSSKFGYSGKTFSTYKYMNDFNKCGVRHFPPMVTGSAFCI